MVIACVCVYLCVVTDKQSPSIFAHAKTLPRRLLPSCFGGSGLNLHLFSRFKSDLIVSRKFSYTSLLPEDRV